MDKYEVVGMIGKGQYGQAWKVRNTASGEVFCLKRIPMSRHERDTSDLALREAKLLSMLDHPYVVRYIESFYHEADLCIVTEYCAYGDLFSEIKARRASGSYLPEKDVLEIFAQIALALAHVHSKRILHRDLKTQNIFISAAGRQYFVKLGDFGISRVLQDTNDFASTVTGTPYYMAPEICQNRPYSLKSDIWSLGCVLYELCSLQHAFRADNLLGLVYQISLGQYDPLPPGYSTPLHVLVSQLLEREPDLRPGLAQVMATPIVQASLEALQGQGSGFLPMTTTLRRLMRKSSSKGSGKSNDPPPDEVAMSHRERIRRRKEEEADRQREAHALHVANSMRDREEARARKARQMQGSLQGGRVEPVYAPAPLQSPATSGSSFYSPLSHGVSNPATPLSARAATPSSVGVPQGWGGQRERSRLGRDGAGGWDAAEPGGAFNEGVWANERDAQARITRGDTGEHTEMATAQSGGFGGVFAIGHGRGTMAGTGVECAVGEGYEDPPGRQAAHAHLRLRAEEPQQSESPETRRVVAKTARAEGQEGKSSSLPSLTQFLGHAAGGSEAVRPLAAPSPSPASNGRPRTAQEIFDETPVGRGRSMGDEQEDPDTSLPEWPARNLAGRLPSGVPSVGDEDDASVLMGSMSLNGEAPTPQALRAGDGAGHFHQRVPAGPVAGLPGRPFTDEEGLGGAPDGGLGPDPSFVNMASPRRDRSEGGDSAYSSDWETYSADEEPERDPQRDAQQVQGMQRELSRAVSRAIDYGDDGSALEDGLVGSACANAHWVRELQACRNRLGAASPVLEAYYAKHATRGQDALIEGMCNLAGIERRAEVFALVVALRGSGGRGGGSRS